MCSLSAVVGENIGISLFTLVYSGQNRGDESIGFGVLVDGLKVVKTMKYEGDINTAYLNLQKKIKGTYIDRGLGHTRYSTRGQSNKRNAQPFVIKGKSNFIITHNGTISNSKELRSELRSRGIRCYSGSDTEVGGRIIALERDPVEGIRKLSDDCAIGAYNLNLLSDKGEIIVFRDPLGFHPLWYGFDKKNRFLSASEDYALYAAHCYEPMELEPGEGIIADGKNIERFSIGSPGKKECFFERIYFEKPGSSNRSVETSQTRYDIGYKLGKNEDIEDAIVSPVEDSGNDYAEGFAEASGLKLVRAIRKNRGERIYMDPAQRDKYSFLTREEKAQLKHVVNPHKVKGKKVIAVDDTIVRCNTSTGIVKNLFAAGADEVHFRIGAPPIISGCIYGLDHSTKAELGAAHCKDGQDIEEYMANLIDADSVRYPKLEDLKSVLKDNNDHCFACLTGEYPTKVPKECRSAIEI